LDVLIRAGNEGLFVGHPFVNKVIIWDKRANKQANLRRVITQVRLERYDVLINLQRHFSTGWLTLRSGAQHTIGYDRNPLSSLFNESVPYKQAEGEHEIERIFRLVQGSTLEVRGDGFRFPVSGSPMPRLYPTTHDHESIAPYQNEPYVCIAPTSVWFTKQWPPEKWVELIAQISLPVWLIGGKADAEACEAIAATTGREDVRSLAGELSLLESAALIGGAQMTFANDSAALHLATAMNAPATAIFCSTVPEFGFGPRSNKSAVVQTPLSLECRPCGLHGRSSCPESHFRCATSIEPQHVLQAVNGIAANSISMPREG
jgi:heptosyltransferase-2